MIKVLDRYITKTLLLSTLLSALVIVGVLFLMSLLTELKNVGQGDYGISEVIFYVLLRLPNQLYQFSPILILLGSIIGLSILSSHRELAVMRASGFSTRQIINSVLFASLFMILTTGIIGELIGPELSYKADVRRENAQNAGQAVITAAGVWFHVDNNFIHVQRVVGRELLEGVTRYQFDNQHHLLAAYYAKTLSFENKKWQMHDVVETTFKDSKTKSKDFSDLIWNLKFNTNLLNIGLVKPSEMSLVKLSQFAYYLAQNGLQTNEYKYDFWQRVFRPFSSIVMVFLAIPFVLGGLLTASMGWRIIVGILVGFTFFILNAVLGQLCVVYQLPTAIAAFLPTLVFAIIGAFLVKKMVRR